jgi:protoporphyrinogen oxidase
MREKIRGDVLLQAPVTGLRYTDDRIESVLYRRGNRDFELQCDRVFSTIPATRLASMFGETLDLRFRNIKLVYLNVSKPKVMPYQWVYFGDGDVVINRMAEFKHFHPDWAETPNTVLCAEVTMETERPEEDVLSALQRYKLLDAEDIKDAMVIPERYGYPVYDRGFEKAKEHAEVLFSRYCNLHCVGRNAEFRHIEVDEDLVSAMECLKRVYGEAF